MTRVLLGVLILAASTVALAATVTVTDAGDSTNSCSTTGTGTCTLRDAIAYANTHSGSAVAFNIAGAGVHTISPASALPMIAAPTTIDGYMQPGASANTNGPDQGSNAVLLIELDGTSAGLNGALALGTGSDGSVIRGLAINRSPGPCIMIAGGNGSAIHGNFLGTDPGGTIAHGCAYGIEEIGNVTGYAIGGSAPADRNVISANSGAGIFWGGNGTGGSLHTFEGNLVGTDASGTVAFAGATQEGIVLAGDTSSTTVGGDAPGQRNVVSGNGANGIRGQTTTGTAVAILGNYVGTDVTGTAPLGNKDAGVTVEAPGLTVGDAAGGGNLISANTLDGIDVSSNGAVILGNRIGTDASGTAALGNVAHGIQVFDASNTTIGGIAAGEGNTIAFNGAKGIVIFTFGPDITGDVVRGNSIHDNAVVGIDLGLDGVTANDLGDPDTGPNTLQNFPIISSVDYGANTTVTGLLNSTPSTTFLLDFYSNPPCSNFPREFLQGETYIGSAQVTTDGSGNGPFTVSTLPSVESGSRISATATGPGGNTSEFSQRLPFSVTPQSGPPAGGSGLSISGTNFLAGATVTVGGMAATGVAVASYTSITATTPVMTPGTANDLVVSNTDGTSGTLVKGFVADFLDVPNSNSFYNYVTILVSNAITAGVGGGMYGVGDNTLRQQMAVFLLKAQHGLCYTPPACTPGIFADVPCPSTFANWIEAMAAEGITGGCGGGNFCPQNPVRRDQMAVFLLKAQHGSAYVPPACTPPGVFHDVPCPGAFTDWVEQLAAESITTGCGGGNYCPSSPNTRGQMAVFITRTFNLQ
jgi:hypothetical protein